MASRASPLSNSSVSINLSPQTIPAREMMLALSAMLLIRLDPRLERGSLVREGHLPVHQVEVRVARKKIRVVNQVALPQIKMWLFSQGQTLMMKYSGQRISGLLSSTLLGAVTARSSSLNGMRQLLNLRDR
jgi:hypothetical protein